MFNKNHEEMSSKKLETIIGPSVKVEGNFKGEGDLLIDGILIGSIETENNLRVGSGAVIEATIKANNAYISGKVKGNLVIKGKLDVAGTAVILGDIKTQDLSIESGARLMGRIIMPITKINTGGLSDHKAHTPAADDEEKTEEEK